MTSGRKNAVERPGRGFTLIELLVVIAIIALLVTILVPSLSEAKGLAMVATCSSQLHGVGIAFAQYSSSYDLDFIMLFDNGTMTGSFEDGTSDPRLGVPGNPALGLCHPDGPAAFEWFLDDARPFFCFASQYNFEDNYSAYTDAGKGQCWGNYTHVYSQIPGSEDPYNGVWHTNAITTDTPQHARDIVMADWQTDFHHYAHYNLLNTTGSVEMIGRRWDGLRSFLWGPAMQPN